MKDAACNFCDCLVLTNPLSVDDLTIEKMHKYFSEPMQKRLSKNKTSNILSTLGYMLLVKLLYDRFGTLVLPEYSYNKNGKPYIDGCYFNISHTCSAVCCVICDREVGVDIEDIIKDTSLKDYILNDSEKKSCPDSRTLTKYFVKKESLVKCEGSSIFYNTKDILDRSDDFEFITKSYPDFELSIAIKKD